MVWGDWFFGEVGQVAYVSRRGCGSGGSWSGVGGGEEGGTDEVAHGPGVKGMGGSGGSCPTQIPREQNHRHE